MKARKTISILLTLTMIISMFLSAVPVSAADITYIISVADSNESVYGIDVKLTEADGTVVTDGEWTTAENDYERTFALDSTKEYKLSITADIPGYYDVHGYSVTFTADGSVENFNAQNDHLSGFSLVQPVDDVQEYKLSYVLGELGDDISTDGTGTVTVNFCDREGELVKTTGYYQYRTATTDRSSYGYFTADTLSLTELPDGNYTIRTVDAEKPAEEGYLHDSSEVNFYIQNGALVTVDNYDKELYAPAGNGLSVDNVTANGFDIGLEYYKVGFQVAVPGIDYTIPYTVVADGSEDNLADPDVLWADLYLSPGTYVLKATVPGEGDETLNYIDFDSSITSVKFVIDDEHNVSLAEGEPADAECENFGEGKDVVVLRLAPKTFKTITVTLNAADGQVFKDYTNVSVEAESGSRLFAEMLTAGDETATYTWNIPKYEYVENTEVDYEDYVWQQTGDYKVVGDWYDESTGETHNITFITTDDENYTATVNYNATSSEPEAHIHAICGEDTCVTDHNLDGEIDNCTEIAYTALSTVLSDNGDGTFGTGVYNDDHKLYYCAIDGGNYYLDQDIVLAATLQFTSDVNLCLNGHMLTIADGVHNVVSAAGESSLTFSFADCNSTGNTYSFDVSEDGNYWELAEDGNGAYTVEGGIITGGHSLAETDASSRAYGVAIYNLGTSYIYGGTIVGNNANYHGGGIYSKVKMYGGAIKGNYALYGGAIAGYDTTIYGGTISHNSSPNGAVCVSLNGAVLTIYGGEIIDNATSGVDIYAYNSTFNMYGGVIKGNTIGVRHDTAVGVVTFGGDSSNTIEITDNSQSNLKLESSLRKIIVNELSPASEIGITAYQTPAEGSPITISESTGAAYAKNFTSDVDGCKVAANGDGLILRLIDTTLRDITVSDSVGGSVNADKTQASEEQIVTLTATPNNFFAVDTVKVTDESGNEVEVTADPDIENTYTFVMPTAAVTVTATFKHYHPVCSDENCGGDHGTHSSDIAWTAIGQQIVTDAGDTAAIALADGNYYLAEDITLGEHYFTTAGTVNLCLNGHSIITTDADYCIMLNTADAVMNLTDCGTTGTVDSSASSMSATLMISNGGTVNIYGGTYGGTGTAQDNTAKLTTGGVLKLYNGTIKDAAERYGCVYVDGSSFYMYGGTVSSEHRNAVSVGPNSNDAFAYIYGGTLSAGSTNEYPIIDYVNGELHIAGAPVFNGPGEHIRLSSLEYGDNLHIDGPLTTSTPIVIYDMYGGNDYYDFTSGWKDHMSTAYAPEFFTDYGGMVPAVNKASGELRFVDESVAPKRITVAEDIVNGTVTAATAAQAGSEVTFTVTPDAGYALESVTVTDANGDVTTEVDADDTTKYTFTMPETEVTISATFVIVDYSVNISTSFVGGKVTADKETANIGDTITLTATPVSGYKFESLTVTDANGDEVATTEVTADPGEVVLFAETAETAEKQYTFTMPASSVTVNAEFSKKTIEGVFTVEAVVDETATEDKDTARDGMHVEAGDEVKIDVKVNGADYTNADWEIFFDFRRLEYVRSEMNTAYATLGYYTEDNTRAASGILKGEVIGTEDNGANADEFKDGDVIVSYYFKALPQSKEEIAKFNFTEAHANTYEMAGIQDNTAATAGAVDVTIILKTEDNDGDETTTPAGSIEAAVKEYTAFEQAGNEYELNTQFKDLATVTYAAYTDENGVRGAAITSTTDADGNGVADDIEALDYRTGLPTWKDVGTYTYYVKISGDGLTTIYTSTTLTITPKDLTPSATFAVDPDKTVTIVPTLEGVLDGSHNGTVTVTYVIDADGTTETKTLNASDFVYDGESTSVYNGTIEVTPHTSGDFVVELEYIEGPAGDATAADNYEGGTNTATVNVDKLTASTDTVDDLETAVEDVSKFRYDGTEHVLTQNDITIPDGITEGTWVVSGFADAYDETNTTPSVTNVGDEALVKVVFTDTTGKYNDIVVYVILEVEPAEVVITVDNQSKAAGEDDQPLTGTIEILDKDGNVVPSDELNDKGFYADDDLKVEYTREPGEAAGDYAITATYVPDANYNVTVIDGKLSIDAPVIGPDGDVKIEVVDLSQGGNNGDVTPDYIAGKRLILVYTDLDKAYYGYGDSKETAEKMFDVTDAGYNYVDNFYGNGVNAASFIEDSYDYKHVYGIVVDKIDEYVATEEYEQKYLDKVFFLGSDVQYAPENIVYDADINITGVLDVNDYSMNVGIYNVDNKYDRATYIRSILKADYTKDKLVNSSDALDVKGIVDVAAEEAK